MAAYPPVSYADHLSRMRREIKALDERILQHLKYSDVESKKQADQNISTDTNLQSMFRTLIAKMDALTDETLNLRQEVTSLKTAFIHYYTQELVSHEAELAKYRDQIHRMQVDYSMLQLQSESTISTLKAQTMHKIHRYETRNMALADTLKFRLYNLELHSRDPDFVSKISSLRDAANKLASNSRHIMESEPISPLRIRTAPVSPKSRPTTAESHKRLEPESSTR
jgi:hypothetical protein